MELFRQPEPSEGSGLSPIGKGVNSKDFSKKLMLFNKSEKAVLIFENNRKQC